MRFAVKVEHERGYVGEDGLRAVKSAGYDDPQVIEIALHVAFDAWTNYINGVAETDIDFPCRRRPQGELTGRDQDRPAGDASLRRRSSR